MGQFDQSHLNIIAEGIRLFNAQKYWECHEELEHHWLEEPGPIRNVYWAVIQVAAALYHYRQQNVVGARGLAFKAKQKIDRCEAFHIESQILEQHLSWNQFKSLIRSLPAEPALLDFKNLYDFRFKDPDQWPK